jgi:hypothetical protein
MTEQPTLPYTQATTAVLGITPKTGKHERLWPSMIVSPSDQAHRQGPGSWWRCSGARYRLLLRISSETRSSLRAHAGIAACQRRCKDHPGALRDFHADNLLFLFDERRASRHHLRSRCRRAVHQRRQELPRIGVVIDVVLSNSADNLSAKRRSCSRSCSPAITPRANPSQHSEAGGEERKRRCKPAVKADQDQHKYFVIVDRTPSGV